MNIAMLGSGFIGRFYADSIQGYRNRDKIVAIYSRREESAQKFAEDYDVAFTTTTMEEAINRPEVKVVCIALPNNLHEEAVMLCCKHKKAVSARCGSLITNCANWAFPLMTETWFARSCTSSDDIAAINSRGGRFRSSGLIFCSDIPNSARLVTDPV